MESYEKENAARNEKKEISDEDNAVRQKRYYFLQYITSMTILNI